MIHPYDFLREIGLNKSEAKLYIAGLELGSSKVRTLMDATQIRKPNIYHALNGLVAKGLADESKSGKELWYVMKPPQEIEHFVDAEISKFSQTASQLDEIVQFFPKPKREKSDHAISRQFVGDKAIKTAIDLALFCESKHWDIVAPIDNFIAQSDKSYINYFKTTRKKQSITSRSLWESRFAEKDLTLADLISRKPRYLPETYKGKFSGMMILFDKKVLFVGLGQADLLTSQDIFSVCNMLFDSLWSVSKKP